MGGIIVGIAAILVAVATYYAGRWEGRRQTRQNRDADLASKVADEYVEMARRRFDSGPHALARLGIHVLGSDALIRQSIAEMYARSGTDPWSGQAHHVENVDLVRFFDFVRANQVDFFKTSVEEVARSVLAGGGKRVRD